MMMILKPQLARAAVRPAQLHCRTFIDWMVNYPDTINQQKKIYNEEGKGKFTWQKRPNDKYVTAFGVALTTFGIVQLIPGHYRLATGKGKLD